MTVYSFGEFRLDADRMEVLGPDGPRTAEPQVFDVLRYLVEQSGRLVTKEELLDNVWGDRFVSESALTTRIKQARRLVGDDGHTQSAIRTMRGRGFRFVADVTVESSNGPARPPSGLPPELEIERTKPFVGRAAELGRAEAVLTRPDATAAWILLLGEPGIGKTRLAGRIAQIATEHDAAVLFGRCSEDLSVPYQPLIEAIRSSTNTLHGDELRRALGPAGHELARLVPELLTELGDLRRPAPADPETERHRLFDAVRSWLESLAAERAVLLVIDDAHWATESTLHLLAHLARRSMAAPVTVVMTARDTAPDVGAGLRDLIATIGSQPGNECLRMVGLDPESARELLADRDDVDAVVQQTAGNPLLIQAVVGTDGSIDIDAAVRRRTARLDRSVRDALTVAALVGVEFDLKVVAATLDADESDLIDDLDTAVEARLLDDVGNDTYRFTHDLVRATLRATISSARRARWHGRIAIAFERVHAGRIDPVAAAIAHHYAEASGANPKVRLLAIDHLRNAARRAIEQLSFSEALDLLERATSLTEPTDLGPLTLLAIERGQAEASAGLTEAAITSFDRAFVLARRARRPDLMAEAALRFEDVSWRPGRFGGPSVERLSTALRATDDGDVTTRARLLVALTRAYGMSGEVSRSDEAFAQAWALIDELGSPALEARALGARYSTRVDVGPTPELGPIVRLRELCDRIDDVEAELLARQIHMRYMARLGRMDDYRLGLREMTEIIDGLHSSFWEYIVANHDAMLVLYEGDLARAEHLSARCADLAGRLIEDDTSGTLGLRMFVIRREQDRLRPLAPIVRRLIASDGSAAFWTPGLALLLLEIGYADEAAAILRDFRDHEFELPPDAMWSTVMVMLIELATTLSDVDSCRMLTERFATQHGLAIMTGHGIACFGSADRYLGMLAVALGELDRAETHLTDAIDFDERNGGVLWANHARIQLSEVVRRRGRRRQADDLVASVRSVAERNGYPALRRLAAR